MSAEVLVDRDSRGVAIVTLNRPDRSNALSLALCAELQAVIQSIDSDPLIRVVTITGAGDRSFCAGADLKERKEVAAKDAGPYVDAIRRTIHAWACLQKVTVGVINGYAFGGRHGTRARL